MLQTRLFSKADVFKLFLVSAFPVHVWAILTLFKWSSSLTLSLSVLEIVSVTAYVLVFALLESLVIFIPLFLLAYLFFSGVTGAHPISNGAAIILPVSISAAAIHLYRFLEIKAVDFPQWASLWAAGALAAVAFFIYWLRNNDKVDRALRSLVDRLAVLSLIYLLLDLISGFVVLLRNLAAS
jgi:hypothetical protein